MFVRALMFSKIRQTTSVTAASDMHSMGMAKYQSCLTKFQNASMRGITLALKGIKMLLLVVPGGFWVRQYPLAFG